MGSGREGEEQWLQTGGAVGAASPHLSQPLEQGLLAPVLFLNQQFVDDSVYVSSRTGCSLDKSLEKNNQNNNKKKKKAEDFPYTLQGHSGHVQASRKLLA